MNNAKIITVLMAALIFSGLMSGCGSKTVAEVNGERVTRAQLDKMVNRIKAAYEARGYSFSGQDGPMLLKNLEEQTLEEMITRTLILQAARKEGVYPARTEIEAKIQKVIKDEYGGEKNFTEELKKMNLTRQDVEDQQTLESAYNNLYNKITAGVKVTDPETEQWYNQHQDDYKVAAQIKARAILIRFDDPGLAGTPTGQSASEAHRNEQQARKMAAEIITELDQGAEFADLAKARSEDEKSKNEGGLVRDFAGNSPYAKGKMPPEFDQAAVALKPGEHTKTPVKTENGYYVIKLESLTPEKQPAFTEVKEKIERELTIKQKQDKFTEYMSNLRQNSKIVNKLAPSTPPTSS